MSHATTAVDDKKRAREGSVFDPECVKKKQGGAIARDQIGTLDAALDDVRPDKQAGHAETDTAAALTEQGERDGAMIETLDTSSDVALDDVALEFGKIVSSDMTTDQKQQAAALLMPVYTPFMNSTPKTPRASLAAEPPAGNTPTPYALLA